MNNDINNSLSKIMKLGFSRYKGCLVIKRNGFFIWNNAAYNSLADAKKAIDISLEALQLSIEEAKERENHLLHELERFDYLKDMP